MSKCHILFRFRHLQLCLCACDSVSNHDDQPNVLLSRRPGGEKIYHVFDNQFPVAIKRLQFDKQLSMENVRKLITEADGYQPHLIAPEQGYRRLIESCLVSIRGPAEAAVDTVCRLD